MNINGRKTCRGKRGRRSVKQKKAHSFLFNRVYSRADTKSASDWVVFLQEKFLNIKANGRI